MLGRTNITALKEAGTATEIEEYRWMQKEAGGIRGNFVKCICKGGHLVAITEDGSVAYTEDGEVWGALTLEYEGCHLNDIDWDGERFLIVGRYMDAAISDAESSALMVATSDFRTLEKLGPLQVSQGKYYMEYYAVMPQNGEYVVLARNDRLVYALFTDLVGVKDSSYLENGTTEATGVKCCITAKNSGWMLAMVCATGRFASGRGAFSRIYYDRVVSGSSNDSSDTTAVFECKDRLYFMNRTAGGDYRLGRYTDSGEVLAMSTGKDFGFIDGVYFDGCEIFINYHEALVVRKGESIAEKTVEDMLEIAPEMQMNCISKAFGRLYVFGNQGLILESSTETGNEAGIAVQTMSAKKALADAKAYADARYAELEERIAALEALGKTGE
nr:hypothetical protein [uncultured Acetatifactor sp.]